MDSNSALENEKFAGFIATGEKLFALEWQTGKIDRISNPEIKDLFDSDGKFNPQKFLSFMEKFAYSPQKEVQSGAQGFIHERYWFQLADLIIDDALSQAGWADSNPQQLATEIRKLSWPPWFLALRDSLSSKIETQTRDQQLTIARQEENKQLKTDQEIAEGNSKKD